MQQAWRPNSRHIPILDLTSDGPSKVQREIILNIESFRVQNSFFPQTNDDTRIRNIIWIQGLLRQELHKIYLFFVALDLLKQTELLLDLQPLLNCDTWGRIKRNYYMVNNLHFDPLQERTHKEVCSYFRSTYKELFEHTEMTFFNISSKIRNHFFQLFA